jgi:pimeloyl-ACP methyl ester carboxylesterase
MSGAGPGEVAEKPIGCPPTVCHPSWMKQTKYVFLWSRPGMEQALIAYEDAVLSLVDEHGGKVVHRARTDGADGRPLEIQLFEWASEEAIDAHDNSEPFALPETIAVNPWYVRYARQRVRTARVEEWAAAWRTMARLDVVEKAKAFGKPTLILSGTKDLSSTPEVMKYMLTSYQTAKFVSIEYGTHFMPVEQPQPVAQPLVDFRREVDVRPVLL